MATLARPLSARARWGLRFALVLAWASGISGTVTSCAMLSHYRAPIPPRMSSTTVTGPGASASVPVATSSGVPGAPVVSAPTPSASTGGAQTPSATSGRSAFAISEAEADVMTEAFERFRRTRVPLAAANFLLSIALVVGAARTIGRRPGGRVWLQQVCVATALFACVEYATSRDERAWIADRLPSVRAEHVEHPGLTRAQAEQTYRASVHLKFLLTLLAQLGLYGGLALALARATVQRELAPEGGGPTTLPPSSEGDDEP